MKRGGEKLEVGEMRRKEGNPIGPPGRGHRGCARVSFPTQIAKAYKWLGLKP